ncbi:MAG: helix-turn-helix domain-containing protein [Thermoleophilia bacterium]
MADILSTASPFSAYVALDEDDRDPVRFLSFLAEALEGVSAGLGAGALAVVGAASGQAGLASEMEAAIEQELRGYQGSRVVLGLDDVHTVESSARTLQSLEWLGRCLPADWLLLLSSRRRLPLDLGALRSAGRLVELGARRLRLTPTEVGDWARSAWGVGLSLSDARAVWRISEGWPVALVLMGRHLGRGGVLPTRERLLGLARRGRHLGDYLAQDVFSTLNPAAATFLMEAFPPERIVFPRDSALFSGGGEAAERLCEELTETGFLVTRTGHRAYTLHRLVREFAEEQARRVNPEGAVALMARASSHLEAVGEVRSAVDVALRAGIPGHAAGAVRKLAGGSLNASESIGRQEWLGRLEGREVETEPWLLVLKARLLHDTGGWREAEALYAAARRAFDRTEDRQGGFQAALGQGFCLYVLGRWEDCLAALRRAEANAAGAAERAEVGLNIGAALLALCRWDEAVERFELTMMSAPAEGRQAFETRVAGHRARVFLLRGRYSTALEWARRAVRLSSSQTALHCATTLNSAATILYLTGDYEQAQVQADAARALIEARDLAFLRVPCTLTRAGIAFGVGDYRAAVVMLKTAIAESVATGDVEAQVWAEDLMGQVCRVNRNPTRALVHHLNATELIDKHHLSIADRVRCLCGLGMDQAVLGDNDAAAATLDQVIGMSRQWGFEASLSPALFYRGWLRALAGDEGGASRALTEAMRLAASNKFVHLYRVEARVALPVLALCARFGAGAFPAGEIVPLLSERQQGYFRTLAEGDAYPTDMPLGHIPVSRLSISARSERLPTPEERDLMSRFGSLTAREFEILRMIALGMPNKVVAGRLYITEKTIKTHTNNIYRKLGVRNRLQAVLAHQDFERLSLFAAPGSVFPG